MPESPSTNSGVIYYHIIRSVTNALKNQGASGELQHPGCTRARAHTHTCAAAEEGRRRGPGGVVTPAGLPGPGFISSGLRAGRVKLALPIWSRKGPRAGVADRPAAAAGGCRWRSGPRVWVRCDAGVSLPSCVTSTHTHPHTHTHTHRRSICRSFKYSAPAVFLRDFDQPQIPLRLFDL